MELRSNIFNITKVKNGIDANSMRVTTNIETIYKFAEDYTEGEGNQGLITYNLSPDIITLGIIDTTTRAILDVSGATIEIILNDNIKLKEIIGVVLYNRYFHRSQTSPIPETVTNDDNFHWYFHIQSFYSDLYNHPTLPQSVADAWSNISQNDIEYLRSFFEAETPTNIGFDIIYNTMLLYRAIPLQIGTDIDAAKMFIKADGIFASIQSGGLKFDANGLQIDNGNFTITNSNNEAVLFFDKDGDQLSVTGNINATSGYFAGELRAATGTFTGSISATTGEIGGFKVGEYSIESTTGDLQLYSQTSLSLSTGEIEQGGINNTGVNIDTDYRVRTKNYTPVLSGHTYIIKTNIQYIAIKEYGSQGAEDYIRSSSWASADSSGYSYTVGNSTNYIRIILAKNTSATSTEIVPEDVESLTIEGNESLINVRNIHIGDGGFIDGSLKVGNLSILNPNKSSEDNTVLMLKVPGEDPYFRLTNEGYIEGPNWSIKKEPGNDYVTARFGKLIAEDGEFNGVIRARDGVFTGEVLSSIITASTINTANFVTENTRSMGGSFIFKPTFEIKDIIDKGSNNVEFELDESAADYFSLMDTIVFNSENFEQGGISNTGSLFSSDARIRTKDYFSVKPNEKFKITRSLATGSTTTTTGVFIKYYTNGKQYNTTIMKTFTDDSTSIFTIPANIYYIKLVLYNGDDSSSTTNIINPSDIDTCNLIRTSDKIVAISGFDTRFGKIQSISNNNITVNLKNQDYNALKAEDALENYKTLTLFGSAYYDTLIGINSDDISTGDILPPHALTMETFTGLSETNSGSGIGDIDYNLNLLLGDLSTLKLKLDSSFNYVNGYGLYADNVYLHGSLMTNANDESYAGIHTSKDINFDYSAWGGTRTNTYTDEKIIFWGGANSLADSDIQRSPFIVTDKGSIFASRGEFKGTVIADSVITDAIIKTPVIYGTGGSPSLKIYDTFHDTVHAGIVFYREKIDDEANDIKTLALNSDGFYHYTSANQASGFRFVSFEEGNSAIQFNGTSLTTGTTTFSSRSMKDQTGSGTAAEISVQGYGGGVKGEIQLICDVDVDNPKNQHGIQISTEGIWNFGGKVQNDGETVFLGSENQQLDYKVNSNGYYCLYVS